MPCATRSYSICQRCKQTNRLLKGVIVGVVLGEGGQWSWARVEAGVRDGGVYECPRQTVWLNLL